jgi:hypothetical protein
MIGLIVMGSALYVWILFGPLLRQRRRIRQDEHEDDDVAV